MPVLLPWGCRNPLCLQAFRGPFCIMHSCFRFPGACMPHPPLLRGQPAPLAQPWAAAPLRASGDAGVLLFVGQGCAVFPRGGAQTRPPIPLARCARVLGFIPKAPELLAVQQVEHPVAAPPAPDPGVKARPGGCAKRTAGASAAPQGVRPPHGLWPLEILWRGRLHSSFYNTCPLSRAVLSLCGLAARPLGPKLPDSVISLLQMCPGCNGLVLGKSLLGRCSRSSLPPSGPGPPRA